MKWTPKCPKCGSGAISVDRMTGWRTSPEDVYLGCATCGNRIYGRSNIEQALEAQKENWSHDPIAQAKAKREERDSKARLDRSQRIAQAQKSAVERVHRNSAERKMKQEQEYKTWLAKVAKQQAEPKKKAPKKKAPKKARVVVHKEPTPCAFEGCDLLSRQTSKYCSIQCKNKYARARFKARKIAAQNMAAAK